MTIFAQWKLKLFNEFIPGGVHQYQTVMKVSQEESSLWNIDVMTNIQRYSNPASADPAVTISDATQAKADTVFPEFISC